MSDHRSAQMNKYRIVFLAGLAAAIILAYIFRFFNLQVVRGLSFQEQATRVSQQSIQIPAQRGLIYDRNDEALVTNTDLFAVSFTPGEVRRDEIPKILDRVALLLNVSRSSLDRKVPYKDYRTYQPLELRSGVPFEVVAYLAENSEQFPGISWSSKPKRRYAEEGSVSHVLGYVGDITTEELQVLYNAGYRSGSQLGKSGIEKQYDMDLRGEPGLSYYSVDATGKRIAEDTKPRKEPVNGKDVYLTIDMNIQRLASEALGDRRGTIVVLKPNTGEVLAMVSKPAFNANIFDQGGAGSFGVQALDPNFPFINRAITAQYPAASPFKIIMETAILENNAIDPKKEILCQGYIRVGDRLFWCHNKGGHGWENLSKALADSCNVYFWTVGKDYLGRDDTDSRRHDPFKIQKQALDFGLGSLTEIDLPNEKEGLIPSKEWKEETYHSPWTGGDTMNMSIGQGFVLVTPLQMANVAALAINDGVMYKPFVLKEIKDRATGESFVRQPEILHTSLVSKATWRRLKADMRYVVTNGTGWMLTRAATVAGKTGTGEIGVDGQYHDWYIAYAPYETDDPDERVVVVVQVEANDNYQWWSTKAADIVIQGIFAKQNYHDVLRTLKPWYMNWRAITGDPWPAARQTVAVLNEEG